MDVWMYGINIIRWLQCISCENQKLMHSVTPTFLP